MTTSPQQDGPGSANRAHLVNAFGETTTAAIHGFIVETVEQIFDTNHAELIELMGRVNRLHQQYGDRPEVQQAAQAVQEAGREHNADLDQQTQATAVADTRRTNQARMEVDYAEEQLSGSADGSSGTTSVVSPVVVETVSDTTQVPVAIEDETAEGLGRRVSDLESRVTDHDMILSSSYDGTRPPSRFDQLETVTAQAFAWARASVSSDGAIRVANQAALIAIGVTFVVYCIIVAITDIEWEWDNALGVPALIGANAWLIVYLRNANSGDTQATSYADAVAFTNRRSVVRPQHRPRNEQGSWGPSDLRHDYPGDYQAPSASAHAGASVR